MSSCDSLGMHLVSIGSQEEQQFLVDMFVNQDYWMGLTGVAWLDGSSIAYEDIGQASAALDQGGVCFAILPSSSSEWFDAPCSISNYYICEKDGACDASEYIEHDGSCYFFSQSKENFYSSKASCENIGMHLVFIESSKEQKFLADNLPKRDDYNSDESDDGDIGAGNSGSSSGGSGEESNSDSHDRSRRSNSDSGDNSGGSNSDSGDSSGGSNSDSGDSSGGSNSDSGDNSGGSNIDSGDSSGGSNSDSGDSSGGSNSDSGDNSGGSNSDSGDSSGGSNSDSGDNSGGSNIDSGDSSGGSNSDSGDSSGGSNSDSGDNSGGSNSDSGDNSGGSNSDSGDSSGGSNSDSGDNSGGSNSDSGDNSGGSNSDNGDSSGESNSDSGDNSGGSNNDSGDSSERSNNDSGDNSGGSNDDSGDSSEGSNSDSGESREAESGYWIGLSRLFWEDGSSLSYNKLRDYSTGLAMGKVCFRMSVIDNFKWMSDSCSAKYHYVCEKESACDESSHDTMFEGCCYHFSHTTSNFTSARSSCEGLGMHLVYIGSLVEQNFLENTSPLQADADGWWIGLSSVSWIDRSGLTFENFGSASAAFDDGGLCYRLRAEDDFQWVDLNCSENNRYVCEKEIESETTSVRSAASATSSEPAAIPDTPLIHNRALSKSANYVLVRDNTALVDNYVRTSITTSSLIKCSQLCFTYPMSSCSCFTYIEHKRACLLTEKCSSSRFETRRGAKTYMVH
ncbi:serine-rich adhesin for platelets-like [Lytechinus pictus]|uniref:serine-rich adhesin for platelets-like n=1 Tax=Lytechinus pictus TaxID=7653 RepID=UPI0030B9F53E